jgi:hypothetical protein
MIKTLRAEFSINENTIYIMEGPVFCEDTLLSPSKALRFCSYLGGNLICSFLSS